jgi:hypothetical protein
MQVDRQNKANSCFSFMNIPEYEYGYRLFGIQTMHGNFEVELGI